MFQHDYKLFTKRSLFYHTITAWSLAFISLLEHLLGSLFITPFGNPLLTLPKFGVLFFELGRMLSESYLWQFEMGKKDTRIWRNCWITGGGSIKDNFFDVIPFGQDEFPVSVDAENSSWNMDKLQTILPHDLCMRIESNRPSREEKENDFPNWTPYVDDQFSLKTTYKVLDKNSQNVVEDPNPILKMYFSLPHFQ